MLDFIFIIAGFFILYYFIKTLVKSNNPLKKAAFSMLTGAGALAAASFFAGFFGAQIAVNIYTVFIALTLGAPGVILIILKIFLT